MLSKFIATPAAMLALSSLVTAAPVVELSVPAQLQLADRYAQFTPPIHPLVPLFLANNSRTQCRRQICHPPKRRGLCL
jgi:hypothetical protein